MPRGGEYALSMASSRTHISGSASERIDGHACQARENDAAPTSRAMSRSPVSASSSATMVEYAAS